MNERPHNEANAVDLYVDGGMGPAERAAFERRMEADGALRAEVELQRRIDARVRAAMTPPASPAPGAGAGGPIPIRRGRIPAWVRVAAVIALAAVGAWAVAARPWSALMRPAPSALTADAVMKRMVEAEGFRPAWVCDTDERFSAYTKENLGVALVGRPGPGVELVGWSYAGGLLADSEKNAQALMVRSGEEKILVVMGPRRDDRTVRLESGSPLHVFRREYAGLVMYEITPLDHAVALESVRTQ